MDKKQIRYMQFEKNFVKSIWWNIAIIIIGIIFELEHNNVFKIQFLDTVYIDVLGLVNIIVGVISIIIFCLISFTTLQNKIYDRPKIKYYISKTLLYVAIEFSLLEDVYLLLTNPSNDTPFMLFALILFIFITVYDIPFIDIILLCIVPSILCFQYFRTVLYTDKSFVAIMYTITIIALAYIVDKYSCDNIKKHYQLEQERITQTEAITNATNIIKHKFNEIEDMREETVIGLANLIENRSGETGGHVKRTKIYVELLVNACLEKHIYPCTISRKFAEVCAKAAPLHDIGKLKVPDYVLEAPRRLSDDEFEIIKKHTVDGEDVIDNILSNIEDEEYMRLAKQIARSHHEKWDGTGYPDQLAGEDIPLAARIMALADVYDALTSKRCYKEAISMEDALKTMKENSGKQFDPILIDIFCEVIRKYDKEVNM